MKEVTPDPEVVKGSVFHRLVQRAFPEWFPYDSVCFFHPFYTFETNSRFAREQGYQDVFNFKFEKKTHKDPNDLNHDGYEYDYAGSLPKKPAKPVYLSDYAQLKSVLSYWSVQFENPACIDAIWFPNKFTRIYIPGMAERKTFLDYFTAVTRDIVKREVITVDAEKFIYQIDVTRE